MNLVLFVTDQNISGIRRFVTKAAELQKTKVNGALIVVHQDSLGGETIRDLVAPIIHLFPQQGAMPISTNRSYSLNGRVSSMFSVFIMQGYARFPGPWLIVDDSAEPKVEDFMQAAYKQHQIGGGKASGRALIGEGSLTPVGPVTIQLPAKDLKSLMSPTDESWRQRGRYLFSRCGFATVSISDYLFDVSSGTEKSQEPKAPAQRPVFDPSKLQGQQPEQQDNTMKQNPAPGSAAANEQTALPQVKGTTQAEVNEAANKGALADPNIAEGTAIPTVSTPEEKSAGAEEKVISGPGISSQDDGPLDPSGNVPVEEPRASTSAENPNFPDAAEANAGRDTPPIGDGQFQTVNEQGDLKQVSDGSEPPNVSSLRNRPYDELERNELFNLFWARTGEKPHSQIGAKTLIKRLEEIDAVK